MNTSTAVVIGLGALGLILLATMSDSPIENKKSVSDTKKPKVEPKKVVL